VRDAFAISAVIGIMVTVMSSMMAFFAGGMNDSAIQPALKTGVILGSVVGTLVLIFALARVRGHAEKTETREAKREAEVSILRSTLTFLSDDSDGVWDVEERVRRERGVLTLDMHGLNAAQAAKAIEKIFEIRSSIQRVRIVTGRGEILHENSADPGIRPAVLQRLRIGASDADWQVLEKSGSITLRPMGLAPSKSQRIHRFAISVVPMCTVMGLTFRDLAGPGLEEQGMTFGIAAGLLLAVLLSGYRDRSG